jgi:MFS transporter, ACS family, hexuronate transporter
LVTRVFRWRIAALVACAITLSYFDRQTLPVAITAIQRDIPISNTGFSNLQAAFLVAYAAMYALGGKLMDVLGTRRGFLLIMLWWSIACASHGWATSFGMLMLSRFLLGLGEGGGFPAATKAVAEWFPVSERSFAMGIMNAGTAVGAVIAPPFIAVVLSLATWRWVFFLAGAAGLVWSLWWWRDYRTPTSSTDLATAAQASWLRLFTFPEVWGIVGAKFLSDAAWYFYLFWFPNTSTMHAASMSRKSAISPGFPTRRPALDAFWEGGFQAG